MNSPNQRLFNHFHNLPKPESENEQLNILHKLDLMVPDAVPIFEEATQMVARFLEIPICFLALNLGNHLWLKSALGLWKLGFMNHLAEGRKMDRNDSFCADVIDSRNMLIIEDTLTNELYTHISLVRDYGIRSYLGIPLITTTGNCLGTLAVMDLIPHKYSIKDQEFLALTARWCVRELESRYYCNELNQDKHRDFVASDSTCCAQNIVKDCQIELSIQLGYQISAPLTNIIGMSKVLSDQTYGLVNERQAKYLEIIYQSGQQISSVLENINHIKFHEQFFEEINLTSTDPRIIVQQVISSLKSFNCELQLVDNLEKRFYLLDQNKLNQTLYYLAMSLLENSANKELKFKINYHNSNLEICLQVLNLPKKLPKLLEDNWELFQEKFGKNNGLDAQIFLKSDRISSIISKIKKTDTDYIELIYLFLGCYLADLQQGKIIFQTYKNSGFQYILKLPQVLQ